MVDQIIKACLTTQKKKERIILLNQIFIWIKRESPETKMYRPILELIHENNIPLREIPILNADKEFRGFIAQKKKAAATIAA